MKVDIIQRMEDFADLRERWTYVHDCDPEAGYFLSWQWMAEVFRANPDSWRILAVGGKSGSSGHICYLPLKHRTRWSESSQRFKTELGPGGKLSWAQYTGVVCLPELEEPAIKAIAATILNMPWARLSFQHDSCERRLGMLLQHFQRGDYRIKHRPQIINGGRVDNLICPQISLPSDYETYLSSGPSSNTRQKMRRFWRQFEASGDLKITDSTPDSYEADLSGLLKMWLESWAPIRGKSSAARAVAKYREVLDQSARIGAIHICTLWREDIRLGALCSIVDRRRRHLYFIVAGRDETVRDPNVGILLHAHNIQWAISNGIETYDFCHGNEGYKYSYGATDRSVANVEIIRSSDCDVGQLDPAGLGQAMRKTIKMLEADQKEAAVNACRQMLPLIA